MSYADETYLDKDVIIGAYIVEATEDGETISFANMVNGEFETINYNSALEKSSK